jgi:hypothetical protein
MVEFNSVCCLSSQSETKLKWASGANCSVWYDLEGRVPVLPTSV